MAGLVAAVAAASCTSILGIGGDFNLDASGGAGPGGATSSGSSSSRGSGAGNPGGGGSSSSGMGGATGSSSGVGPGGGGGAGASGPITGIGYIWQVDVQGHKHGQTPIDFTTGHVLDAISVDGNGTWSTAHANGALSSFEIDGVPPGPYLLDFDGTYYWLTNRDNVSLEQYTTVRATAQPLVHDPTVQFNVTQMTAWVPGDVFEMFSPSNGAYAFQQDGYGALTPDFMPGDTSVVSSGPWSMVNDGGVFNLLTPSDPIWLFHLGKYGLNPYTTIVDYVDGVTTTQTDADGAVFNVTAAFGLVEQTSTVQFHGNVPAFNALLPAFNAAAVPAEPAFTYDYQVSPAALDVAGQIGPTADLVLYQVNHDSPDTNYVFSYGNPFPGWPTFVSIGYTVAISETLPGLSPSGPRAFNVATSKLLPDDPLLSPTNDFKPLLTPATHAAVDGVAFTDTTMATLGSLTPTITWDPPTTGQATHWEVTVIPVEPNGMGGTAFRVGIKTVLCTDDPASLRIPPGILSPNSAYVFMVRAFAAPNDPYESAPGRDTLPVSVAATLSNLYQTPSQ